jgi:hypothetical protein
MAGISIFDCCFGLGTDSIPIKSHVSNSASSNMDQMRASGLFKKILSWDITLLRKSWMESRKATILKRSDFFHIHYQRKDSVLLLFRIMPDEISVWIESFVPLASSITVREFSGSAKCHHSQFTRNIWISSSYLDTYAANMLILVIWDNKAGIDRFPEAEQTMPLKSP